MYSFLPLLVIGVYWALHWNCNVDMLQKYLMVSLRLEVMKIDARRVTFLHWNTFLLRCNEVYPNCSC